MKALGDNRGSLGSRMVCLQATGTACASMSAAHARGPC